MKMIKKGLFLCMGLYQGIGWVIWKFSDGPVTTSTMKEDKIAANTLHSNTM